MSTTVRTSFADSFSELSSAPPPHRYQCAIAIGTIYEVKLPPRYSQFTNFFTWLDINWSSALGPVSCLGTFEQQMLLTALSPFVLIAFVIAFSFVNNWMKRQTLRHVILSSLGPCLSIVFLFMPSVSRKIFQTWDCTP